MRNDLRSAVRREIRSLFQLKKTERLWHIPALASLCTGLPLLLGYSIGRLEYGLLACLGGLAILYMPSTRLEHRMITQALCAFGFVLSFTIGICFSFNPYISAAVLGFYGFGVNFLTRHFRLPAPGNFFFIMIASMASCMPVDIPTIPTKIGLIALGAIFACIFAFLYSIYITWRFPHNLQFPPAPRKTMAIMTESITVGIFAFSSLLIAHLSKLDNPYWIPISCLAVMQGVSVSHVWQRGIHRIAGTFVGMGVTWLLLQMDMTPLIICVSILILQFIIEMLVVRHYGLAVIFITPMTVLLSEIAGASSIDPTQLVSLRVLDITIGSCIGILGGLILHNQQIRKTRIAILRRKS
jgi:hypothetical protein